MKYLFINSVVGVGSTGRIVADQCRELQQQGHQCVVAFGRSKANCDDIQTVQIGTTWDYKWHGVITRVFDRHGFGSKRATKKFLEWVAEYDPDVIWLHNIHGYYINIEVLFSYLKICGKQIKWTLHDCWAFTGHCSHFDYIGCERWKINCYNCPQKHEYPKSIIFERSEKNFKDKKSLFSNIKNLSLIVPSKWLGNLVGESFLKEYPVQVVYNKINLEEFKPTKGDFRKQYGLENKKVILGVASVWSDRKGLADFFELANKLSDEFKIVLVGLNEEQLRDLPDKIIGIRRTNSVHELAEIYTGADIFVNPTYEDTYPTVNLEAQACGTKVITYDVGGAKETIILPESYAIPVGVNNIVEKIEQEKMV